MVGSRQRVRSKSQDKPFVPFGCEDLGEAGSDEEGESSIVCVRRSPFKALAEVERRAER